ncbi:response regulator [Maribellus sp. YY47]|nr:response regulator [Maribellus sp. YY47]
MNEEYGISMRETNHVCADDDGFIWISSKMGILRYTQDEIKIYQLPYESEDIITVRLEYTDGKLYAYTNNGQIFLYNTIQDEFEIVTNLSKQLTDPHVTVNRLLVDQWGTMWEASSFGLLKYNSGTGLDILFAGKMIDFLERIDDTHFYFICEGQILIFDIITSSWEEFFRFSPSENSFVSYMKWDKKENTLWLGTLGDGLYYLKVGEGQRKLAVVNNIPNQPVQTIEAISDSTFLIGIDGQGVWEINKYTKRIITVYKEDSDNQNSLKGNGVYDIFCDKNKRVWICTYTGGVSFFDQASSVITKISHVVNNANSLVNNDVNSVLEDGNGNLWFATNNGLSFWNTKNNRWSTYYRNMEEHAQVFLTLCEDSKGRIWAGSYSSGIYVLDRNTGRQLKHLSQTQIEGDFAGDFVFDIMEDSQGDIWIGGVRGDLIRYNIVTNEYQAFDDFTVYIIKEYSSDKLLLGTTYGLLLFDKKTGQFDVMVEGFVVSDVYMKDNVIWIATSGDGVIRYDISNKTQDRYTIDAGLSSNFVNSIEYCNGYFWLGTEQGLCRLKEEDRSILSFNSLLYLNHVSFNQDAHFLMKNGKLLLGSNIGALMFEPDELKLTPDKGRIFIQDILVAGRSIREIDNLKPSIPINNLTDISLKYYQNTISLELIPIGVTSPGSKFSWKLDELEEEWSKPSNNRILSYSNIASGVYTLKIRMFDSSSSRVIAERTILLNMIPPYWETWWFRLIVALFIVGVIVFSMLYYADRLKKIHSEEKIRFFANTAHDIRTSLTLINGPIEELNKEPGLSDKGLHYLHLATDQTQRMLKVVTQLMDFQKSDIGKEKLSLSKVDLVKMIENRVMMFESYARSKNIEIRFSSNFSKFVTAIDETLIDKVIDNLISNAIKYSFSNTEIQVNLQCSSARWILEVQDQGIGISKKAQRQLFKEYYRAENVVNSKIVGSGIGLLLVKNYVNLHDGKISCYSQLNQGSSFQVVIPTRDVDVPVTEQKIPDDRNLQAVVQRQELSPSALSDSDEINVLKMKVLIVEDNEYLREFLKSAMEPQFKIYLAEDGVQAWEMIQKQTPDMVVSDVMMPNMDGFELCQKIKSTYETSHLPIILLTALAGKAELIHGLGLGADDYLTKPFDVSILQQRIRTLIQNREIIRDKALKIIRLGEETTILDNELNDKFLKRMIEIVHENISNAQFSKNDFAWAMNVSPSLLYKKIKALTDQSPTDFIKSVRLNHAIDLLKEKKYTITEVSELCGFASVGYFSTVFRKHFGKSPTQVLD